MFCLLCRLQGAVMSVKPFHRGLSVVRKLYYTPLTDHIESVLINYLYIFVYILCFVGCMRLLFFECCEVSYCGLRELWNQSIMNFGDTLEGRDIK
ncbi:unnamed protein product [Camellia sinensis]